ncbi:hypothetical protein EH240_11125 [Mesorhizobium tamadayense]|uniref:DNA sulfur modification protein DndD n=1 Tax=Mesorhizobium tamadayense TaxID=425306 RepID=A0A3P3FXM7_9HYPH|nr:hypothetical protein [Mesorhizobium tamadayense]RRI03112.1 hypothetical protein EH240_11125 [Mesorhizobium tamadayense]
MKFVSFDIENMFAYNGTCSVDLSETQDGERNIVLIKGRNGAGKTSLLNSAKLLFAGAQDESLRRVGFSRTALTDKQYVLGQPGRWSGVFNKTARQQGHNRASVSLCWTEGGVVHRARRTFVGQKSFSAYSELVEFGPVSSPLDGNAAEDALQAMLPRELVPFFFFDGEQVQSLADAEIGREAGEIERLLGLHFVAHLIDKVNDDANRRSRARLPVDVMKSVVEAENAAREARANEAVQARARVAAEEELLDLEARRARLDGERQRLRSGTLSESEAKRFHDRLEVLATQRQTLADELAERLPLEIVFRTQPHLVDEAFAVLDRQTTADASLAGRLHAELPAMTVRSLTTIEDPVTLNAKQQTDLQNDIRESLRTLGVVSGDQHPVLASLSAKKTKALRDRFLVWRSRGAADFAEERAQLRRMRELVTETRRLRKELDEAELSTDEARARYEEITAEITRIGEAIRDAMQRSAKALVDEKGFAHEAVGHDERAVQEMKEYKVSMELDEGYRFALRAKRALERYLELRRSRIRQSVEDRVNQKVAILLAPSELVKSVRLDGQFIMSYFDQDGEEVSRHSISAGMRQLIAMSMLWALKEEAARSIPVIVDTPLGRIDSTNRNLLMRDYFPEAGAPLILLPTDTEFTEIADDLLGEHIRRRYRIDNEGGETAKLMPVEL